MGEVSDSCTPLDHARDEPPHVSHHRQSQDKYLLWNTPVCSNIHTPMPYVNSHCAWMYVENVLSPSSSWSERNSPPYLTPRHECPCSDIHCLLMLSIQCTHCTASPAGEGIKIYCSSQPNIFKIEWCARKDFWNSRSLRSHCFILLCRCCCSEEGWGIMLPGLPCLNTEMGIQKKSFAEAASDQTGEERPLGRRAALAPPGLEACTWAMNDTGDKWRDVTCGNDEKLEDQVLFRWRKDRFPLLVHWKI